MQHCTYDHTQLYTYPILCFNTMHISSSSQMHMFGLLRIYYTYAIHSLVTVYYTYANKTAITSSEN